MCGIKKLNRLKRFSIDHTAAMRRINPLSLMNKKIVTGGGLTYTDLQEKLDKISSCASIIELKESWEKKGDDLEQIMQVAAANYCKQHAVCPICADRSQARRRARYDDPIKNQVERVARTKEKIRSKTFDEKDTDNRFAYLVTYTVTDGESLGERLSHLKKAKRSFCRQGQRRSKGRSCGEAGKIRAAISTVEIKRGENSKLWHVHAHDLVFSSMPLDYRVYDAEKKRKLRLKYGDNIPREELSAIALNTADFRGENVPASKVSLEWLRATGGDSMGLDVEPLRHVPRRAKGKKLRMFKKMSFAESIAYQAREALKYITEPWENDPYDELTIIDETFNKRMTATYGQFRGIVGDDYNDPAADDENTFVLLWDDETGEYGDPQPGKLRELLEEQEAKKARSMSGQITGSYRRQRKELVSNRSLYGDSLFALLDDAKRVYRARIRGVWSLYRQAVDTANRGNSGGCDKYSSTLALSGAWVPGSDRRTVYGAVFA